MNLLMLSGDTTVARGREGAFSAMLRRFSRYWDRIDILTPRAVGASEQTLYDNVFVHPSTRSRAMQPFFIRDKGAALMAERTYALITSHDFGFFYNGIGAARLSAQTGVPYVSEIHHIEGYPRAATARERLYRALAMPYIRWAAKRAAAFRAVNAVEVPALLRHLGVPEEKILVLPSLYIDFDVFRPLPDEPRYYDVLFVGRLVPNKGLYTLLDAIATVRQSRPDVRAGLLGRGPLEKPLRQRIEALGLTRNVDLHTNTLLQEDVVRFYNSGRMLVCASTAEGGPRVTVEAMACGVPVISTPVGVMPELIKGGRSGLLFEWDAAELAEKILHLLNDDELRQRIGEAGRAAVQPFQADAVIERYALELMAVARAWEIRRLLSSYESASTAPHSGADAPPLSHSGERRNEERAADSRGVRERDSDGEAGPNVSDEVIEELETDSLAVDEADAATDAPHPGVDAPPLSHSGERGTAGTQTDSSNKIEAQMALAASAEPVPDTAVEATEDASADSEGEAEDPHPGAGAPPLSHSGERGTDETRTPE